MDRLVRNSRLRRQDAAVATRSDCPLATLSEFPNCRIQLNAIEGAVSFGEQRSDVRLSLEGDPERFIFEARTERTCSTDKPAHRWRLLGEISVAVLVQKS